MDEDRTLGVGVVQDTAIGIDKHATVRIADRQIILLPQSGTTAQLSAPRTTAAAGSIWTGTAPGRLVLCRGRFVIRMEPEQSRQQHRKEGENGL